MSGTLRDFIYILEGLLEQQTSLNPTRIMTDTADASDIVFGLFQLLGYQFSPCLADASFWRLDMHMDHLQSEGATSQSEDRARLSSLQHRHLNVLGRYSFVLADPVASGKLRPRNIEERDGAA